MKKTKKFFSLLEIFVVLFLVLLVGSFLGVKGHFLFEKSKFDASMQKVKSHLKECRDLARLHGQDTVCAFKRKNGELFISTGFEGRPLKEERLSRLVCSLNGEEEEELVFHFYASGSWSPSGELSFTGDKSQSPSHTIDLSRLFQWEERPAYLRR